MDFYSKIKELEYIHSKIQHERTNLERRIEQKKDYQKMFYDIRAQEIQEELARIETVRIKNQARNQQLLNKVQETLSTTYTNDVISRSKEQLDQAKKTFLKDLNQRDPLWRDKMRNRKLEEVKRTELDRERLRKDLKERQGQLEEELALSDHLNAVRHDYQSQQDQLMAIDRQRMNLVLEQEIQQKRRDLEQMDRQIYEGKKAQQDILDNEQAYRDLGKQQNENVNPNNEEKPPQYFDFGQVKQSKPPSRKRDSDEQRQSCISENRSHSEHQQVQTQQKEQFASGRNDSFKDSEPSKHSEKTGAQQAIMEEEVDDDFDDFLNRKAAGHHDKVDQLNLVEQSTMNKNVKGIIQEEEKTHQDPKSQNKTFVNKVQESEKLKQEGCLEVDDSEEEEDQEEEENSEDEPSFSPQKQIQEATNTQPSQKQNVQQFQPPDEEEYYYEEEVEEEEEEDESIQEIRLVNSQISDTFREMKEPQKAQFASVLCEYIEKFQEKAVGQSVFEKERQSKFDEKLKIRLISKYNQSLDSFSEQYYQEFDMGIVCDLLLDILRNKAKVIVDAQAVIQDNKAKVKQGVPYSLSQFMQKVKSDYYALIIKDIFKLIAKMREAKAIKTLAQASFLVSECLLTERQSEDSGSILGIVKNLIDSLSKKQHEDSKVTGFKQQQQPVAPQKWQQPEVKAPQSDEIMKFDLDDELRINIARELKQKIEKKLPQYSAGGFSLYNQSMLSQQQILQMKELVEQIKADKYIPKDLQSTDMTSLLMLMLGSRPQPNIDQTELAYIEESGDLSDFKGFIRDQNVKSLFDIIMKHLVLCIKKKVAKQKEVEILFSKSLINFKCLDVEQNIIKKYISDSISKSLGFDSQGTNNLLNAGNSDFNNQQQQFFMKRTKPMSASSGGDKVAASIISPSSPNQRQLAEFEENEILDDY